MRILLAEDENDLAATLAEYLRESGHEVCVITTGGLDVLPAYDKFRPDIVLMDIMMPRFNGITISHALVSRNPRVKIILMSGVLTADHPFVTTSGACAFIPKPFTFAQAGMVLENLIPAAQAAA